MTVDTGETSYLSPGTYRLDPDHSSVTYSGRHMFGLGGVTASFALNGGRVTIADPMERSDVEVQVDASSFRSDKPKRDEHVLSASMLDAATYPEITFASTGLRRQGSGWTVSGAVTAHGATVPVEVNVADIRAEDGRYWIHATAAHLDRYAFGVDKVKGMAGRYLDLEFDILAVPE